VKEDEAICRWTDAGVAAVASCRIAGAPPDGSAIRVMPFGALGQPNETDAGALHLDLSSSHPG
jgi:hypothetical protein